MMMVWVVFRELSLKWSLVTFKEFFHCGAMI